MLCNFCVFFILYCVGSGRGTTASSKDEQTVVGYPAGGHYKYEHLMAALSWAAAPVGILAQIDLHLGCEAQYHAFCV